jgi:hypothetical protein
MEDERIKTSSPLVMGRKLVVRYQPLGLIGVIGPWNYPLTNSFGDCIPALAAGNAVILKPSEVTPNTSLLMAEMLRECGLPEHVYQVATGKGETAEAVIDEVDMIMFTGSTRTGKKVMARAAETLTPVSLELGGKDPMIVLSDADLERAANAAVYYSMQNGGQTCVSSSASTSRSRCTTTSSRGSPRRPRRCARASRPASAPSTSARSPRRRRWTSSRTTSRTPRRRARPSSSAASAARPGRLLRADGHDRRRPLDEGDDRGDLRPDAADHEGRRRRGGHPPGQRLALRPVGLRVDQGRRQGRGDRPPRAVGSMDVNDAMLNYSALELPMGGWKASGLGTRHGAAGIRKYCAQQAILVTRFAPKKDLHMFPYKPMQSKVIGGMLKVLYGRKKR